MDDTRIELYGHVNKNGRPMIMGIEKFDEFFKQYKNKRFLMDIRVIEPYTVDHHVWYIVKMIVPAFVKGHREKGNLLTPEEALDEIREACPMFYRTTNTKYKVFDWKKNKPNCVLSPLELEVAIDWLHMYCVENFNIVVGNFKTIGK